MTRNAELSNSRRSERQRAGFPNWRNGGGAGNYGQPLGEQVIDRRLRQDRSSFTSTADRPPSGHRRTDNGRGCTARDSTSPPATCRPATARRSGEADGREEVIGKDALAQLAVLLGTTEALAVGTCDANISARPPQTAHAAAAFLAQAFPARFTLGLGVGHPQQASSVDRPFGSRCPPCGPIWTQWRRKPGRPRRTHRTRSSWAPTVP
ncbi:LLM class flavin-dependent oxidoreductase [Amycolatopsis sp. NPDC005232]|uniref:LLM class flavin-dependent oxidoreductase n=1 Tax=Amycolatopsis sp. NPDC005232 TaxID=3157027 RepID=UPI0033B0112E